jgi:hypothetical protein
VLNIRVGLELGNQSTVTTLIKTKGDEVMDRESGIMQLIYNKINDLIGAGNQLFSMQFPAQPLNYRMYQYDTSDRNSVLTKPYTISENEFRLCDQLFDVSPITAGSNGEKLSVVYNTLINNFIPQLDYLAPFIRDRAGLGHFLLEDSGEKDENGNSLSRISLCKQLYLLYLEKKNEWNEEKSKKYDELKNQTNGLDEYAKWQSSYAMVKEEELNNLYNQVVVRGHLHEVLTILGYLNASSVAEELEVCKQKMRNSARISLDESMTVYPVQFQPNNWFKALTPNLNPEDLTMARDSIRDQFLAKQRELSRAKAELQQMQIISATPQEIATAHDEVQLAKQSLNEAESGLIKQYGQGLVGIAKIYFKVTQRGGKATKDGNNKVDPTKAQDSGATDTSQAYIDSLTQAVEGIEATYSQQQKLTDAISNLSDLQAKKVQLESRDWRFNQSILEQRIQELQADVDYYANLLASVSQTSQQNTNTLSTKQTEADAEISGMFQDIVIKISNSSETSEQSLDTQAKSSKWGVSLWFASASGQSNSASATSSQRTEFFNQEIEIGFRVAKVSFDRGGWFNPQLFKMSHAFYHLADLRVAPGLSIDQIKDKSQSEIDNLTKYDEIGADGKPTGRKNKHILPSFPVAMAIAKDITIKVKTTADKSTNAKSVVENSSASSGGFLCFSVSSASSSKNSSESTFHGHQGEFYYIRIPGPQVIGYFLQFVSQDNSTPYKPTFTDKNDSPIIKAFQLYDQASVLLNSADKLIKPVTDS